MSRVITGTLLLPNNISIGIGTITFIASETYSQVLEGTVATCNTNASGVYSITLIDGRYLVYFNSATISRIYLGKITVEAGIDVSLDTLLSETNPLISSDIQAYVDNAISCAIANLPAYLTLGYDVNDKPSDIIDLSLSKLTFGSATPTFGIHASWTDSTNVSGVAINYEVSWWKGSDLATIEHRIVTTNSTDIYGISIGTWTVKVLARAAENTNLAADTSDQDSIAITGNGVTTIDYTTVTAVGGIEYIVLSWTKPANVYQTEVWYCLTTDGTFILDGVTLGSSYTFNIKISDGATADTAYFFKFKSINTAGEKSVFSSSAGSYQSIRITDTTVGRIIAANTLDAQQFASDLDLSPNMAIGRLAVDRLDVLDLDNQVANNNFSIVSTTEYIGWTFNFSPSIIANSVVFPANSTGDNSTQFTCTAGEKIYGAVWITWTEVAGVVNKGFQIKFLNVADELIDNSGAEPTGYTGTDTTSTVPGAVVKVDGFVVAPTGAVKAYIQLKTGAVTNSITYSNVVCRHGSAVTIEDGELTADKINVANLLAQDTVVAGHLKIGANVNSGSGDESGLILGAEGLIAYADNGDETLNIAASDGSITLKGDITSGSTIAGATVTGSEIIVGATGSLHSLNKDTYGDNDAGFFLGLDSGAYKLNVGDGTNSLKWDGTDLTIKGDITAGDISGVDITGSTIASTTFEVGQTGNVHSANKTSYADTDAGFFLGYDSTAYKLNIGDGTNSFKWTGAIIDVTRESNIAAGTKSGGGTIYTKDSFGAVTFSYPVVYIDSGLVPGDLPAGTFNLSSPTSLALEAKAVATICPIYGSYLNGSGGRVLTTCSIVIGTDMTAVNGWAYPTNPASGKIYIRVELSMDSASIPALTANESYAVNSIYWTLKKLL